MMETAAEQLNTPRARFVGIFVIALVGIAYQVLLTRIFSVTLYYHLAFAGISLAMLGLTVGAEKVYLKTARFTPQRFEEEWAKAALGFAVSGVLLVLWFLCAPLVLPPPLILKTLTVSLLLFIIPFTYSGICVTLILTRSPSVGKLYAADLTGAALGCVGIVSLLFILDPVSILFLLAALTAWSAWFMVRQKSAGLARGSALLALLLLGAAGIQGGLYLSDHPHLGVSWAKGKKQDSLLFERWNAFSRVRVISFQSMEPFGWGFGHKPSDRIAQKYLDIDADASTVLSRFDGDLKRFSFLDDDVINVGYHLRPVRSVAVVGVGGGRDVMSALYFGARKIFAIELNPAIIEALTHEFADFTGHFVSLPQVSLVNAEARSWLAQHHPRVDLVQISLVDTWAATAAGGLTLSENRLYTLEAWKGFFDALSPGGMLEISRWYMPVTYNGEFYRLLSLAAESLKARGVPSAEISRHIFAFNVHRIVTVVVSPMAFSPAEVQHAHQIARERNFTVLVAPDFAMDDTSRIIVSGNADRAFYDGLSSDISAPTDNRPFFFYTARMKNALSQRFFSYHDVANNSPVSILLTLFFGILIVTINFVIEPLVRTSSRLPMKTAVPNLAYFASIGLGFMLIEISQMQRLMIFLGHPIFGLSVVLFTLLLFGGLGSASVPHDARAEKLWIRPLVLCLVLSLTGLLTPSLIGQFVAWGTFARIAISVALLAPAGFFMGMMLPIGMLMSYRHRDLQPWLLGINGSMSVFSSIFGMLISMQYGIAAAYWTGVGTYALCLCLAIAHAHSSRRAPMPISP